MKDVLLQQLEDVEKIEYVIAHHAEQDHSGCIPQVLEKYPNAQVLATPKGREMLIDHLCLSESRVTGVEDGEKLGLGDKTLEFLYTPWVHWPETMSTYLLEDKILFSCDFFGSHLATSDLYAIDKPRVYEAAKRYYAEIMMPFRKMILKNLEKIKIRELSLIAPSHGPIYNDPAFIINAYEDWISSNVKNLVVIPYISMHGSTMKMVDVLVGALIEEGVEVQQFDLTATDLGKLAISLVDAATIVVGSPTVLGGPHPLVVFAASLANALHPKAKFASIIGSYGWSSKVDEKIAALIPALQVELIPPVLCKGFPRPRDFEALELLAKTIAEKHKLV